MYEDINDMLPWRGLDDYNVPSFLDKYFRIKQMILKTNQWCRTHDRFCSLDREDRQSDFEIGGFPCQPNSRMGNGLKEQDPRFVCLITWSFHLRRLKKLAAILENTHET